MTKEEAIKLLRANVMVACDTSDKVGYGTSLNKAIEEALVIAIKALEQQPCDDCVSRQAVLDCLTATGLKKFDFIIDAREKVNNLPPVTPTLPKCATNGDMIKAMFPNQTISCAIPITDRNGAKFLRTTINGVTDFTEDWWNAPYKGVKE